VSENDITTQNQEEIKKHKFKVNITKKEIFLVLVFSFAFIFSFFIFNQVDIIFSNQQSFGFTIGDVVWGFIISAFIGFLTLSSLLFIMVQTSKKVFKITIALLFGFMLASYFQVLFLNGNYITDMHPNAADHSPWGVGMQIFVTFVWFLILFLPLGIAYAHKIPKIKRAFKKDILFKSILFASAVIFVMQGIGLGVASTGVQEKNSNQIFYFSVTQQLNLSEGENIVVFLIDRWPIWQTDEVFRQHPHAKEFFPGFTYFRNNLSEYPQTFPSVTAMLTGINFNQTNTRRDFSQYAWEQATLFDELYEQGFTRNAILDSVSTFFDIEEVVDYFDNIVFPDEDVREVHAVRAVVEMANFTLQRIVPYPMKNLINIGFPHRFRNIVSINSPDYFPNQIWRDADPILKDRIEILGLSANPGNTFSFIHMNGPHSIPNVTAAIYSIFKMLDGYFQEMKRLGIYDNSTIILMSDHGTSINNRYEDSTKARFLTSLFIKESGAPNTPLQVDSVTPLSNSNFLASIFELIGAKPQGTKHQDYGYSFFDIIRNNSIRPNRYIGITSWNVGNRCVFYERRLVADNFVPLSPWTF